MARFGKKEEWNFPLVFKQYSILAYESSDISSKEELTICGRLLVNGKVVECFLDIVHATEVNAKALTEYLLSFLNNKGISLKDPSMCGSEQLNILTSFYGIPHTISFESTTSTYTRCCS